MITASLLKDLQADKLNGNIELEIKSIEDAVKIVEDLNTQLANVKTQNDQAKAKVSELEGKLTVATDAVAGECEKVKTLTAEVTDTKTKLQEKTEALDKIDKDRKAEARIAQLKDLGVSVADDKKRADIAGWSDETFASVVEFTKTLKPAKADDTTVTDEQKAKELLEKAKVENTEPDPSVTAGDTQSAGEVIQKAAAALASELFKSRKQSKDKKKE